MKSADFSSTRHTGPTLTSNTVMSKRSKLSAPYSHASYESAQIEFSTALILDNIGFASASQSCILSLSSMMQSYFELLCRGSRRYANYAGRDLVNLSDVSMTFKDKNVSLTELHDYIREVKCFSGNKKVPLFPVSELRVSTNNTPEPVLDNTDDVQKVSELDKEILSPIEKNTYPLPQKRFPDFTNQSAFNLGFTPNAIPSLMKVKNEGRKSLVQNSSLKANLHITSVKVDVQVKEERVLIESINQKTGNNVTSMSYELNRTDNLNSTNVAVLQPEIVDLNFSKKKRKEKDGEKHKKKDKKDKRKSNSIVTDDSFEWSSNLNKTEKQFISSNVWQKKADQSAFNFVAQKDKLDNYSSNDQTNVLVEENLQQTFSMTLNDDFEDYSFNLNSVPSFEPLLNIETNLANEKIDTLSHSSPEKVPKLKLPTFEHKSSKKEKKKKSKHDKRDREQRKLEKLEKKHKKSQKKILEEHNDAENDSINSNYERDSTAGLLLEGDSSALYRHIDNTDPTTSSEQKSFKIKIKFGGSGSDPSTIIPSMEINDTSLYEGQHDLDVQPSPTLIFQSESDDVFNKDNSEPPLQLVRPLKISVGRIKEDDASKSAKSSSKSKDSKRKQNKLKIKPENFPNNELFTENQQLSFLFVPASLESSEVYGKSCKSKLVKNDGSQRESVKTNFEDKVELKGDNEEVFDSSISLNNSDQSLSSNLKYDNGSVKKKDGESRKKSSNSSLEQNSSVKNSKKKKSKTDKKNVTENSLLLKSPAESLFDDCFGKENAEKASPKPSTSKDKQLVINGEDISFNTKKKKSLAENVLPTTPPLLSALVDGVGETKTTEKKKKLKTPKAEILLQQSSTELAGKKVKKTNESTKESEKKSTVLLPNLIKEKPKSIKTLPPSVSQLSKYKMKEKSKKREKPATSPPPVKRKKVSEAFSVDSLKSEKKSSLKTINSNTEVVKQRSLSALSSNDDLSQNSDGQTSSSPTVDDGDENIWICPVCSVAYVDGAADMVGCDECNRWFHWHCVGLLIAPPENKEWFCHSCIKKRKKSSSIPASGSGLTGGVSSAKKRRGYGAKPQKGCKRK